MLTSLTIVALLVGGVISSNVANRECLEKGHEECQEPDFGDFPETKEKVDSDCRLGISYMRCLRAVLKECKEPEENTRYFYQLLSYVETEVCNEDSHIYQALANNIKCIKETHKVTRKTCVARGRRIRDKMTEFVSGLSTEEQEEEQTETCLNWLFHFACSAAVLAESCGEPVGEAFTDVALNVDPVLFHCPPEITQQMTYAVQIIRSVADVEEDTAQEADSSEGGGA